MTELERKLKLEVLTGSLLPVGTEIQINCNGVVGSKREANDGISYFGSQFDQVSIV